MSTCATCGLDPRMDCVCCKCVCIVPNTRPDLQPEKILELQTLGDANPKDQVGKAKVDFSVVPMAGMAHEAHAMMDGARKYGPFNWRGKKVSAKVYVAAILRHVADWFEREDLAPDSGAHHLGHAKAGLGILLDAIETGNLIDDRPTTGAPMSALLDRLNKAILDKGLHLPKESK